MRFLVALTVVNLASGWIPSRARANEVNRWNDVTMNAIRTGRMSPPFASRLLAMVHVAIFDSANGIHGKYNGYSRNYVSDAGLSEDLAIAAAARKILTEVVPLQRYAFENAFNATASRLKSHPKAAQSVAFGEEVAVVILGLRQYDASFMTDGRDYVAEPAPGRWVPTQPTYESPLTPKWGQMKPFALTAGHQFRPAPPPALDSADYRADLADVFAVGGKNSSARSGDQTEIARFWADGAGTNTPPGHMNVLARAIAQSRNFDLLTTARMLALLNIAMADSAIACWDAKFAYWFWRPITAIREHGLDGIWEPLLFTPYFPEYVSGHSTFSAAAFAILAYVFGGDEVAFSLPSDGLPGVTRNYVKISQATAEAGRSRIFGGIHFEFSNQGGQKLGAQVGKHVIATVLKEKN